MKVRITDKRLNRADVNIYDISILLEGGCNSNSNVEIRVIEYIEEHQNKIKKFLQDYYYELSQKEVYDNFQIENSLNYFWTLVNEERNQLVDNPLTTKILKYLAIEDILSKYDSFSLYLEIEDPALLEAVIQRYPSHQIVIPKGRYYSKKNKYSKLKKAYLMIKGIVWYFKKIIISYVFFKIKIDFPLKEKSIILAGYFDNFDVEDYKNGINNSKYWGSLNEAIAGENIYSYFLNIWVDNGSFRKYNYRRYIQKFNIKSLLQHHYILDSFITKKIILKTLILWFKLIIVYKKNEKQLNTNPIHNITKITRDYSVYGWIGIRNIHLYCLFQDAFRRIPNSSNGIYLQEFQSWEYLLNNAWENSGHQKLLGYTHVPLKNWDLRSQQSSEFYINKRFMNSNYPDFIGVDCSNSHNILVSSGCPKSIILKLESLRFTTFRIPKIEFSRDNKNKVILFVGDYIPESNMRFLKYLHEVDSFSQYRVIIKPHPNCPISIKGLESRVEISNDSLNELFAHAEMVICGQSTTSCIDVKYANIKLGIVCDPNNINLNLLHGNMSVFFIKNNNEMCYFINCNNFQLSEKFKFYYKNINASYRLWRNLLKKLYL